MIGISMCNSVAKMSVHGGIDPVMGTNPISISVPAGKRLPLVFDAATSLVALGKVIVADIEGRQIPEGWALDRDGNPTTIPTEALKGAILPFGSYKGSGLAIMVDVFTAMLSGAQFGLHTGELRSDPEKGQEVGFFFGAIDIAAFQDVETFKARTDQFIDELKASRKAARLCGNPDAGRAGIPQDRTQSKWLPDWTGCPEQPGIDQEPVQPQGRHRILARRMMVRRPNPSRHCQKVHAWSRFRSQIQDSIN